MLIDTDEASTHRDFAVSTWRHMHLLVAAGGCSRNVVRHGLPGVMNMNQEYESLGAEILKWQDRRFQLIEISIGLVTAIIGLDLVMKPSTPEHWPLISSVLLAFLSSAGLLTWYAGRANSKLSAYLKVFHEAEELAPEALRWETRLQKLKEKGLDRYNVNHWITVIFIVLAGISVLLPYIASSLSTPTGWPLALLLIFAALFVGSAILVSAFSYPRESYEARWRQLQRGEQSHA